MKLHDCEHLDLLKFVDTAPWQRILSTAHQKILNPFENSKVFFGNSHSRVSLFTYYRYKQILWFMSHL